MKLLLWMAPLLFACATQTSGRSVDPAYPVTGPPSGGPAPTIKPPSMGPSGSVSDFYLDP